MAQKLDTLRCANFKEGIFRVEGSAMPVNTSDVMRSERFQIDRFTIDGKIIHTTARIKWVGPCTYILYDYIPNNLLLIGDSIKVKNVIVAATEERYKVVGSTMNFDVEMTYNFIKVADSIPENFNQLLEKSYQ